MRFLLCALVLFLLILQSCSSDYVSPIYVNSGKNYPKLANRIINQNAEQYKKKRGWDLISLGGSYTTDVKTLKIQYWIYEEVDISQARALYVECVDSLLVLVNSDLEIRPYLHDFPFTWKNISIILAFYKRDGTERVSKNHVAYVGKAGDHLIYCNFNECTGCLDDMYEEPYEQAEQIVHQTSTLPSN